MSFVIIYRSPNTEALHPIVSEAAYGIREFDSCADAERFAEKLEGIDPERISILKWEAP